MIAVSTPGHPVKAGAGYDCCCGECQARRALLRGALRDAAACREDRGGGRCARCDEAPDGLCDDHMAELALAAGYRALMRELGAADG